MRANLQKSYGITGNYQPRGSHATTENPLPFLTLGMKENIAQTVHDYYNYFKPIVATGRAMLVDNIGGGCPRTHLDRRAGKGGGCWNPRWRVPT
jgi:hypothetical protein